jgi:DNA-directed RNA polymerase sigma subunit (sigma70/sigma32)
MATPRQALLTVTAEIGRELGLSHERVCQLEAQARRQLYTLAKAKALDDYLNSRDQRTRS